MMDYATVTDNSGKKADFRNVIIIMTSNAGAREHRQDRSSVSASGTVQLEAVDKAVEQLFSPEFRNRLDKVVVFSGSSTRRSSRTSSARSSGPSRRL